ncbi:MAG: ATP:Cob(I)alamin adenosyltransferase [uncultured Thermomicrobiales bacterium]|uniref:Corrinoid adenosyltransferase n=1 Tax=uncultured Thermomicrobiales bacterium TaxID=1645740 RepID=A0A6J4UVT4_9BACT|nr:MAG: ATP:Cob(I)alamin adenosyltransferase [uncultured Thermomicrobiales bacterium]
MRLFSGKGDGGETDLLGARVDKDDPRIALLGELDEATSAIGLGRAHAVVGAIGDALLTSQRDLYGIMADLAFTDEIRPASQRFAAERVTWLEGEVDRLAATVTLPPHFILPGDTVAGATLDVARTVVRRAERAAVTLHRAGGLANEATLRYLNRLSSLLFIAARAEDAAAGITPRPAKADLDRSD